MNRQWHPCFAMDVADAFSEAKLEFVAASSLTDNFPDLTMTEEQRAKSLTATADIGMRGRTGQGHVHGAFVAPRCVRAGRAPR